MALDVGLGPLMRLRGLRTAQLPPPGAGPAELAPFLAALLREGVPFVASIPPAGGGKEKDGGLWKSKGRKSFPPAESEAGVDILERLIPSSQLPPPPSSADGKEGEGKEKERGGGETWVCRRSVHADAARRGTASWAEFAHCIRDEHAATEDAFTPSVVGAREVLVWEGCSAVPPVPDPSVGTQKEWGGFSLKVVEMQHKVGRPVLKDRVFPVLQMSCSSPPPTSPAAAGQGEEFLVISIPVTDLPSSPHAQLSRAGSSVVVGAYASIERVRLLPATAAAAAGEEGEKKIEWVMATASDARGALPPWVQALAVPGQIAKDVPLFLSWLAREREAGRSHGGGEAASAGGAAVENGGEGAAS